MMFSKENQEILTKPVFEKNNIKVINLKKREDRKNSMIEQFKKENVTNFEFIEAVDGNELKESEELRLLFERNNFTYRKGIMGCALSHIQVWNSLINDTENSYYVVLEDDLELSSDFKVKLNRHCQLFEEQKLEHLSLGSFDCNHLDQEKIKTSEITIFQKDVYKFWNVAFAYIISKDAARKMVSYINNCSIKCAIDNPLSHGEVITYFHTTYCIAKQKNLNDVGSDIQNNYNNLQFTNHTRNNKDELKIAYCDWWYQEYCGGNFDFNNNFITDILRKYGNVNKITLIDPNNQTPDVLLYSIFGNEHVKYPNVRRVFFSGEPFGIRAEADFNFTFDRNSDKNTRFPLWLGYLNDYLLEECQRRKNGIINVPKRENFCSFIANGEVKTTHRRTIVEKLSAYKNVHCGGNYLNNIGFNVPRGVNCSGKIEHNNKYKFAIAFENEDYPGYVTEKICDIYKSNCVPIYWGTKEVINDFNPSTFINARDFANFDELVEYIIKVDNDDELYASFFKEPMFSNKWLDAFNDPNKTFYKNLADCIISKNKKLYDNYLTSKNNNIKIFNIWHNKLFDKCYKDLDEYSLSKVTMYDVNPKYTKFYTKEKKYNIVREYELPQYNSLYQDTNYCQTSCLYHVFKHNLHITANYIGFIQYDMDLASDFIYDIEQKINQTTDDTFFYSLAVANKIEVTYICKPYNNSILEKYNNYYNTNHTYESIKAHNKSDKFICLHTFVIPTSTFIKMMTWYCTITDWLHTNYINGIYTESMSEVTEEIFGLFLLLQIIENDSIKLDVLKLNHEWPNLHNETEWVDYKVRMPEIMKHQNELAIFKKTITYNLSIMGIFKNETMNLRVWLEHYLWQGVEHFYLIDNGSTDEPLSILQKYIDAGVVTYYFRNEKYQQVQHYRYVFDNENLKEKTKWLCICDLDEFFFGTRKKLIDSLDEFNNYNVIYTNSYFYGSDNLIDHPKDIRTSILHREEDIVNGTKYIFKPSSINNSSEIWIHWLVNSGTTQKKQMTEIIQNDKIRLNHYRIQSFEYFKNVKMTRGDVSVQTNENIRDLKYFEQYTNAATIKDDILKQIVENGYDSLQLNNINTAVIVEPRFLKHLPFVINDFYKKLGLKWKIVFYCGKGLQTIWLDLLKNPDIEIRELKTNYYNYSEYCDFIKSKELWENLYGDYVLLFTANSTIINKPPYTIDYFMSLNKSYTGGNQCYLWNEMKRENIYPPHKNFQGGLSLRKRLDMIKIIDTFGSQKTLENCQQSQSLLTDAEDVYFTIGCYKLGLPVGDDESSSHFSVHNNLKDGFFGANGLESGYYLNLIKQHDDICDNIYLFKDIQDIDSEILSLHPSTGFFSNCTVKLLDIILYFNTVKKLPIFVDGSQQFDLYKANTNKNDITSKYFSNNFDYNLNYEYPIDFREQYQYTDYETLSFKDLTPFIKKYFTPSEDIKNDIHYIENKYNIENYEDVCVLFYRGNDKATEVKLPSYESTVEKARTLYNENNNIKFLVQSDEIEFIERMIHEFPNNSFYFKDEIRTIKKSNELSVDKINPESNFIYSQYYLAITIIMSKCKYVVCNTGNCSLWIALFRGNTDNFYQIDKFETP